MLLKGGNKSIQQSNKTTEIVSKKQLENLCMNFSNATPSSIGVTSLIEIFVCHYKICYTENMYSKFCTIVGLL